MANEAAEDLLERGERRQGLDTVGTRVDDLQARCELRTRSLFRNGRKALRRRRNPRSMLSIPDVAILGGLALLLFGPERLPKIARDAGRVMRDLQNTSQSFVRELERAADTAEEEERLAGVRAAEAGEAAEIPSEPAWSAEPVEPAKSVEPVLPAELPFERPPVF
ncbi:hypothetical protein EPN44_06340 [bacterium]|nr:MAG: hypothetical protein EPN44_06340 [bacterium]